MKDFFSEAFRLTFAGTLYSHLSDPRSIGLRSYEKDYHKFLTNPVTYTEIKGQLPLRQHGETGETVVGVRLVVRPNWMNVLPVAFTDAPFLRLERDWHIPIDHMLCYGLDMEWNWQIGRLWEARASSG